MRTHIVWFVDMDINTTLAAIKLKPFSYLSTEKLNVYDNLYFPP
jgi:hypothetical protein